jgi:hypothetical protein
MIVMKKKKGLSFGLCNLAVIAEEDDAVFLMENEETKLLLLLLLDKMMMMTTRIRTSLHCCLCYYES